MEPVPRAHARWAARYDGPVEERDRAASRAQLALEQIGVRGVRGKGSPTIRVLGSARPGAFAWPDGRLYVTRGLVDLLDDHELAAAVAHEVGHLRLPAHVTACAAIDGHAPHAANGHGTAETEADAEACRILAAAGLPVGPLATALQKVRDDPASPADVRPALTARIDRLRARLSSQ